MVRWLDALLVSAVSYAAYSYFHRNVDTSSVRGKKVLVTGASQNIGEEIAYQYAKLEAKIVITARREQVLKKVAAKCLELGAAQAEYIVADMADETAYQSVVQKSVKIMGGLDILVLNHVLGRHFRWNGSNEDLVYLKKSTSINYWSYVEIATAATPALKQSQGQLIVVGSQAGRPALPNVAAYGATKAAVINFFSSLSMELMLKGEDYPSITICYLGAIDTDGARWATKQIGTKLMKGYPLSDTASGIIKGGLRRDRYIYLPGYLRLFPLIREISPSLFDKAILYLIYGA